MIFPIYAYEKSVFLHQISQFFFFFENRSVVSSCLWPHGLYSPWNSPGQNIGVGSLSLLQGIFPTWGSNRGLLHYRQVLHQLSYQGSPSQFRKECEFFIHFLKLLNKCLLSICIPGTLKESCCFLFCWAWGWHTRASRPNLEANCQFLFKKFYLGVATFIHKCLWLLLLYNGRDE